MTDDGFAALEYRLWALFEPYRDRLEPNVLYGMSTLRWPGTKAHDFFGAVRVAPRHVALHLMPIGDREDLRDGLSPELRRRLKGKATFNFATLDPALETELVEVVRRCFEAYRAAHEG
jgi:hypothetical protein